MRQYWPATSIINPARGNLESHSIFWCSHCGQWFSSPCLSGAVILAVLLWLNHLFCHHCAGTSSFSTHYNFTFYKITLNYAVAVWGLTYFIRWKINLCCRIVSSSAGWSILWFFNLSTVQAALAAEWTKFCHLQWPLRVNHNCHWGIPMMLPSVRPVFIFLNLPFIVPSFIETFTAPVMPVPSLASSVGSSLARTSCNVGDIVVASVLQPSTLAMASQPFVVWSGLGICLS